jgi:uncharacterized cupin superfamily protein
MKPVINLDELRLESEENGVFSGSYAAISERIGAKKLGYNLTVLPPGMRACPFHNHHENEELFFILEGSGTLRFGSQEYAVRQHDVIACPPGGREVAHQIINTGDGLLKYLAVSTQHPVEIVQYPDSDKIGVFVGQSPNMELKKLFKADSDTDYFAGEKLKISNE